MTNAPSTMRMGRKPLAWPRSYPPAYTARYVSLSSHTHTKMLHEGTEPTMIFPLPKDPDQHPDEMAVISLWHRPWTCVDSGLSLTAIRKSNSSVGEGKWMAGFGKWSSVRLYVSSTLLFMVLRNSPRSANSPPLGHLFGEEGQKLTVHMPHPPWPPGSHCCSSRKAGPAGCPCSRTSHPSPRMAHSPRTRPPRLRRPRLHTLPRAGAAASGRTGSKTAAAAAAAGEGRGGDDDGDVGGYARGGGCVATASGPPSTTRRRRSGRWPGWIWAAR